jgi:DNA modification methylase
LDDARIADTPNGIVWHKAPTDVWSLPSGNSPARHDAVFPEALVERAALACSSPGDLVLDPFAGVGTTCVVAARLGRRCLGIELNPEYAAMASAALAEAEGA